MKVKFNRNVKHDGVFYEQGHTYEFEGELTPELKALLDLTHTDVYTQKSTNDQEHSEEVHVAEAAPEDARVEAQPAPVEKTKSAHSAMPPAPNI